MQKLDEVDLRQNFYDFPNMPYHVHLGITFDRPDPAGPAIIEIPASEHYLMPDGTQSVAAVYTVGEVAAGIAVCDALVPYAVELGAHPVVLTTTARFTPLAPAHGAIRAECEVVDEVETLVERLVRRRKAQLDIDARTYDEDRTLAGRSIIHFYVRLVDKEKYASMAPLVPGLAAAGS
jgi:hypothetical protein